MVLELDPQEVERAFLRDGFVRLPVFSPDEVRSIRGEIYRCYRQRHGEIGNPRARDLTSRDLLSAEVVLAAVVHPRITGLLQTLLGASCAYLPDFEVHINQYGVGKGGWHIDCGSEIPAEYLVEPAYRFVKCGIYLQDNSPELGGGIDVLPGLHRWLPPLGSVKTRFRAQYVFTKILRGIRCRRLPLAAGDFVAFDSRLPHRGSSPGAQVMERISERQRSDNNFSGIIPSGQDKMVIYFDACRSSYAKSFLDNSVRRAKDEIDRPIEAQYRAQYLGLSYPDDFPPTFRRELDASGIRMAVYDGADKAYWAKHWHDSRNEGAVS